VRPQDEHLLVSEQLALDLVTEGTARIDAVRAIGQGVVSSISSDYFVALERARILDVERVQLLPADTAVETPTAVRRDPSPCEKRRSAELDPTPGRFTGEVQVVLAVVAAMHPP